MASSPAAMEIASSFAGDLEDDQMTIRGDEAEEEAPAGAGPSRRRQVRIGQDRETVPIVHDQTGEKITEMFQKFLEHFSEDEGGPMPSSSGHPTSELHQTQRTHFYIDQVRGLAEFKLTTLYVDYQHLIASHHVLAKAITDQYYRFLPFLRTALQNLVKKYCPNYLYTNSHTNSTTSAGLSVRTFALAFYNMPLVEGIRDLRTDKIGKLASISGTVTRTSEVRPELIYGTFQCSECKGIVRDVEQQFKYTEPTMCPNRTCNERTSWKLLVEQSKFSDWQRVRIQENSNEIPTGSMPRSLDVILRGEIVERAKAGDKSIFTGTFIVVPDVGVLGLPGVNAEMMRESQQGGGRGQGAAGNYGVSGLRALGVKDLTYKTAFLACMASSADTRNNGTNIRSDAEGGADEGDSRSDFLNSLTKEELDQLTAMVNSEHIYSRLVSSIAPTVYGHEIVKKGILLQLMGGVHKETGEGMHLRGDLNVCIVGDPSTSKSQFLKYVCGFLPRAVYTSGKASSAAGLTAAVVKDEETGEFTIEAGALMLADNGICAIDEFDKMDLADQVAIHEAMEQQTISIAKAGIQATLNARTSILAAANPVGGRYNRKQSLRANVAMSAPIMSRFDLFFVVLDDCNPDVDFKLAQHIVNVHRYQNVAINPEFSTDELQRYIRFARTFNPKLTAAASRVLVEKYRDLRAEDSTGYGRNSYRVTVRQLESMVRLSEAIARANCKSEITPAFVKEAYGLLSQSIIHVEKDDVEISDDEDEEDEAVPTGADAAAPSEAATSPGRARSATPAATPAAAAAPKKAKVSITYDRYMDLMQKVVYRVHEHEQAHKAGMPRADLVQELLEEQEGELADVEAMEREQVLLEKVLGKLVKEKYLLEVKGRGLDEGGEEEEEGMVEEGDLENLKVTETVLLVHPECDLVD